MVSTGSGFLLRIFFRGGAKSIVMQISVVMLLLSNQISGRGKSFHGGKLPQGGRPPSPCGRKPGVYMKVSFSWLNSFVRTKISRVKSIHTRKLKGLLYIKRLDRDEMNAIR